MVQEVDGGLRKKYLSLDGGWGCHTAPVKI
jgi:hypothetical protein